MRVTQLDHRRHVLEEGHLEGTGYRIGDLRLQLQHVTQIPVVCLRPQVKSCRGVDQLRRDARRMTRAPDASLEHGCDVELPSNCAEIDVLPLEVEGRCAACNLQFADAGEGIE